MIYTDYHQYPELWAKRLNISREAIDLYLDSEVIDIHTDTYVWRRLTKYNVFKRHKCKGLPFGGQVDFPKCLEANMAGVVWDIATNPYHRPKNKLEITRRNVDGILADLKKQADSFQHVITYSDYLKARKENKVASWISLQGGQAIDNYLGNLDKIPEVHRITLVHFNKSKIGASNFDKRNYNFGLTKFGKEFTQKMVENKIMVDLSHINRTGFFDALEVVPNGIPVVVTHSGVDGVNKMWRNIDDQQIKAIAKTGGTIGVVYHTMFLSGKLICSIDKIIDHMEHIINLVGDDFVSLGSDYDGMIILPRELKDITYQPILVQKMLNRDWSSERIKKILGTNFLRVIKKLNP